MKMAGCDFVIKFEFRPCLVDGRKAMWHRWTIREEVVGPSILNGGHGGGQLSATFALVEFEDGTVAEVYPDKVRFLDSAKVFEEYDFSQQSKEEST